MATVYRLGFTRLSGEAVSDDQFRLNIIFVHGLRGHPRGTWEAAPVASSEHRSDTTKKHKCIKSWFQRRGAASPLTSTKQAHASSLSSSGIFWPEQYLALDIPQAKVWTYGYNADIIGGLFQANNKNSISQHGQDLSVRLEREINNSQPIAFVAHSLGGIVVKDAIHRSEKIRERTKLIIFLGTPHRGSVYAGWAQIASNLASLALQDSNKKMLKALEVNSEVLDIIHEEFKIIVFKGGIKIHSFQEGRGIAGVKGLDGKVVDDFSSKLDLPRTLETVESIDADHMQMARYNSKDNQGYRNICGVLSSFIQQELEPETDSKGTVFAATMRYIKRSLVDRSDSGWKLVDKFEHSGSSSETTFAGGTFTAEYPGEPTVQLFLTIPSSKGNNRADWTVISPNSTYYPGKHAGHLIFRQDFPFSSPALYWDTPILSPYPRNGEISGDMNWSPTPRALLHVIETMASIVVQSPRGPGKASPSNYIQLHAMPKSVPRRNTPDNFLLVEDDWMRQCSQFFCRAFNRIDEDILSYSSSLDYPVYGRERDKFEAITGHHRQMSIQAINSFIEHVLIRICKVNPPFTVDGLSVKDYFSKAQTIWQWVDGEKKWARMLDEKSDWMVSQNRPGGDNRNTWYRI